jgi:hypothetical protein
MSAATLAAVAAAQLPSLPAPYTQEQEYLDVVPCEGLSLHPNPGAMLRFGDSMEDVVTELGEPSSRQFKGGPGTACFFTYAARGLDVLFEAATHRVLKFVLHTNAAGHPDFGTYTRCSFRMRVEGGMAPALQVADATGPGSSGNSSGGAAMPGTPEQLFDMEAFVQPGSYDSPSEWGTVGHRGSSDAHTAWAASELQGVECSSPEGAEREEMAASMSLRDGEALLTAFEDTHGVSSAQVDGQQQHGGRPPLPPGGTCSTVAELLIGGSKERRNGWKKRQGGLGSPLNLLGEGGGDLITSASHSTMKLSSINAGYVSSHAIG